MKLRNAKSLIFSGSDWRVIHKIYGQSESLLFIGCFGDAKELFDSINAHKVNK
jgi:hypothetical protein